jgi:preprotein translocase subunit SecY
MHFSLYVVCVVRSYEVITNSNKIPLKVQVLAHIPETYTSSSVLIPSLCRQYHHHFPCIVLNKLSPLDRLRYTPQSVIEILQFRNSSKIAVLLPSASLFAFLTLSRLGLGSRNRSTNLNNRNRFLSPGLLTSISPNSILLSFG